MDTRSPSSATGPRRCRRRERNETEREKETKRENERTPRSALWKSIVLPRPQHDTIHSRAAVRASARRVFRSFGGGSIDRSIDVRWFWCARGCGSARNGTRHDNTTRRDTTTNRRNSDRSETHTHTHTTLHHDAVFKITRHITNDTIQYRTKHTINYNTVHTQQKMPQCLLACLVGLNNDDRSILAFGSLQRRSTLTLGAKQTMCRDSFCCCHKIVFYAVRLCLY